MRNAAFRNVHLRHDLEAADERGQEVPWHGHGLGQHAVHAVPHADAALLRLDVDVRGSVRNGLLDERVGEADNGSLLGKSLPFVLGEVFVLFAGARHLGAGDRAADVGAEVGGGCRHGRRGGGPGRLSIALAAAVILADRVLDGPGKREHHRHAQAGGHANVVLSLDVGQVARGHVEDVALFADGDHVVVLDHPLLDHVDRGRVDGLPVEVYERDTGLLGPGLHHLALTHIAEIDQDAPEFALALLVDLLCFVELLGLQVALLHQPLHHRHSRQRHLNLCPHPTARPSLRRCRASAFARETAQL